jgi:hypothetical protein
LPINFTVTYDDLTNDLDDTTGDIGAVPAIGPVVFVPSLIDRATATANSPRPAGYALRTFSGWLDNDGQLKSEPGGTVGVRMWANDPIFELDRLQYRVEADLTDPLGRPVPWRVFAFDAPTSDLTVNLVHVMPDPSQEFSRGPRAYDITELSVDGSNDFVFEREDGYQLPAVPADFAVNLVPSKGRAVAMAIALG